MSPSEMKVHASQTYIYFKKFEKILLSRSGYQQLRKGEPFYICSNTGPWLFARFKVAWRTMAAPLQSCVVSSALGKDGKPPMFKNTVVFVPIAGKSEAHYLCACINSSCVNLAAQPEVIVVKTLKSVNCFLRHSRQNTSTFFI